MPLLEHLWRWPCMVVYYSTWGVLGVILLAVVVLAATHVYNIGGNHLGSRCCHCCGDVEMETSVKGDFPYKDLDEGSEQGYSSNFRVGHSVDDRGSLPSASRDLANAAAAPVAPPASVALAARPLPSRPPCSTQQRGSATQTNQVVAADVLNAQRHTNVRSGSNGSHSAHFADSSTPGSKTPLRVDLPAVVYREESLGSSYADEAEDHVYASVDSEASPSAMDAPRTGFVSVDADREPTTSRGRPLFQRASSNSLSMNMDSPVGSTPVFSATANERAAAQPLHISQQVPTITSDLPNADSLFNSTQIGSSQSCAENFTSAVSALPTGLPSNLSSATHDRFSTARALPDPQVLGVQQRVEHHHNTAPASRGAPPPINNAAFHHTVHGVGTLESQQPVSANVQELNYAHPEQATNTD